MQGWGARLLTRAHPNSRAAARRHYRHPRAWLTDRIGVELLAVALGGHEHGRHGHDRLSDDPVRHGTHDTGTYAAVSDGVCVRVRDVDCDDGRHDDALGSAHDSHVRPCGPTNSGAWQPTRCNCLVRY